MALDDDCMELITEADDGFSGITNLIEFLLSVSVAVVVNGDLTGIVVCECESKSGSGCKLGFRWFFFVRVPGTILFDLGAFESLVPQPDITVPLVSMSAFETPVQ
jgi:hypothetical protein